MNILKELKKMGINPLTIKYVDVKTINVPVTFIGFNPYGEERWLSLDRSTVYRVVRD